MSVLQQRLAPGEELIQVKVETSRFGREALSTRARLFTLKRMWELASGSGDVITHGPEITEIHAPSNPGDPAWMVATAIARRD
jgi:hypothetical protein